MQNLLLSLLQPADWDDREFIEDPNDVKPEVFDITFDFFIVWMCMKNLNDHL
jgi:hypothetical protein